jgi:hypothetical protein
MGSVAGEETDTERRENVLAARFRDTERQTAGVGLSSCAGSNRATNESLRCSAPPPGNFLHSSCARATALLPRSSNSPSQLPAGGLLGQLGLEAAHRLAPPLIFLK